ncbi:MAG: restriction endonuclease subunit S [Methanoregula sp.]|nr:restriction endonuclease subunit S [Methanoregula sp.]
MEGDLPEGWEWAQLGEAAEINMGQSPPGESYNDQKNGLPLLNGPAEFGKDHPIARQWTSKITKKSQVGDILFCVRGATAGRMNRADQVYCLGRGLAAIRGKQNKSLTDFLNFYLLKSYNFFQDTGRGSTFINISQADLNELKIPLPPLAIQREIVAVLEQAEAVTRQRQEADALTGALLQSVFREMFGDPVRNEKGWPLKNIKEFSAPDKNAIKAGPFGSSLKKECYTKTGFKIYGQEQVIKDDLQFGDYYISREKYQELINYSVQAGDILISLVGSYGKISIVPESFEQGIINPRLMKISLNQEKVLPIFFKHLFLTDGILNQVKELSHGGTMDIINVGIVKQLKFPVPPLALQQQFARVVESVERIRERQVASGKEIEGLCGGLMVRAFAGELVA